MSEVRLPGPVKARLVPNLAMGDPDRLKDQPGDFEFAVNRDGREKSLIYCCPCGCGDHGALSPRPPDEDDLKYGRHTWEWDGNRETPTLSPSVHHVGHWHGFLKAGFWIQA